jgi:hypothetical protein
MLTGTTSVIDTERQNGRSAIPSLTGEKPTLSGHHRNGGFDPKPTLAGQFCCDAQLLAPNDMLRCGPRHEG